VIVHVRDEAVRGIGVAAGHRDIPGYGVLAKW